MVSGWQKNAKYLEEKYHRLKIAKNTEPFIDNVTVSEPYFYSEIFTMRFFVY